MGLAGRLICLAAGRIVAEGPPAAVRRDPRVGEIYFGVRP
jgi:ABC-type branched-subunit amino acid transport system ATPase component